MRKAGSPFTASSTLNNSLLVIRLIFRPEAEIKPPICSTVLLLKASKPLSASGLSILPLLWQLWYKPYRDAKLKTCLFLTFVESRKSCVKGNPKKQEVYVG